MKYVKYGQLVSHLKGNWILIQNYNRNMVEKRRLNEIQWIMTSLPSKDVIGKLKNNIRQIWSYCMSFEREFSADS